MFSGNHMYIFAHTEVEKVLIYFKLIFIRRFSEIKLQQKTFIDVILQQGPCYVYCKITNN